MVELVNCWEYIFSRANVGNLKSQIFIRDIERVSRPPVNTHLHYDIYPGGGGVGGWYPFVAL